MDAIHLPVPLNIVLVGFAGDGNMGVNISLAELNTWFQHLDHVLPHTRIDASDISCQEDGERRGRGGRVRRPGGRSSPAQQRGWAG